MKVRILKRQIRSCLFSITISKMCDFDKIKLKLYCTWVVCITIFIGKFHIHFPEWCFKISFFCHQDLDWIGMRLELGSKWTRLGLESSSRITTVLFQGGLTCRQLGSLKNNFKIWGNGSRVGVINANLANLMLTWWVLKLLGGWVAFR